MLRKLSVMSIVMMLVLSSGCASQRTVNEDDPIADSDGRVNVDPWEGFNRAIFSFNLTLDRWVLKPVAKGYDFIAPDLVQTGVSNFFDNINEVPNIINDVLQWKWHQAANDSARLLINSTVGVAGLMDVGKNLGLPENEGEDFGQTLAHWGVKRGPYLVLPFWGSTSVREGLALPVDFYVLDPVTYIERRAVYNSLSALRIVHNRAELFEVEELASGDMYIFVRDAYLQSRDYLERDGKIDETYEDDFGDEDF